MRWWLIQALESTLLLLPLLAPVLAQQRGPSPAVCYRQGRRCLLGSSYVLPKDASEHERLDAQHVLMHLLLGANYLAPLQAPRAILDVGCGTGRWCREMAYRFPQAHLIGLDYDPRLLSSARPPNVTWQQGNALDPLPYLCHSFDFVHLRFAATWLKESHWLTVLREVVRVTRPGGLVELVEGDMPTSPDPDYQRLCSRFSRLLRQRGLADHITDALEPLAAAAGLVQVEGRTFTTGVTKDQQTLLLETTRQGFKSLLPLLKQHLTPAEYAAYSAHLAAVEHASPLVTRTDKVVWGQKPLSRL